MIAIPLYTFLGLYLLLLGIFTLFFIINIAHLVQTSSLTFVSFVVTFIFFASVTLLIYATMNLLEGTQWQYEVIIFNKEWFVGLFIPRQLM
ncbi:MAG: hypothetical protein COU29_02465 [Candidatus Magasanikbacteria bacterium CG10_big_fil_rev_8_21_14_0_10_36_32]|uniref:Uncharacterized protein n=1 Tax=Candidatus Magasanikbacteria bacterium CG10_big_fil_rev_8_21_14_0_10_36_32 TaxID=1974646 RepID=A0A2M6W767_9BACT|nr:MAG: hypothetical protein COU29_02465 [Candidatus Magasanikbacteria bacterium CG10_big_fil_rev_8_21_14_0_10_36_32]